MRAAFVETLAELAGVDPRILLLTGDLGYRVIETYSTRWPERYFNVGVAEQNLIGLATGLAEAGFVPFVYSIVPFAVLRPLEFIRNGPALHHFPVRIAGVGGGFGYGHGGMTHYGLEDIGVMRTQPDLTIIAPADQHQARAALEATWDLPGPVYYRLGKDDRIVVPGLAGRFSLGHAHIVREGSELLLITMGDLAAEVVAGAELLESKGVSCAVMVVSCLAPAPVDDLVGAMSDFPLVLTVEAHSSTGGVGSMVAEVVAEKRLDCRVVRCGAEFFQDGRTGSPDYLRHRHGLSRNALFERAMRELRHDK